MQTSLQEGKVAMLGCSVFVCRIPVAQCFGLNIGASGVVEPWLKEGSHGNARKGLQKVQPERQTHKGCLVLKKGKPTVVKVGDEWDKSNRLKFPSRNSFSCGI